VCQIVSCNLANFKLSVQNRRCGIIKKNGNLMTSFLTVTGIERYWGKVKQSSGKHMSHILAGTLFNASFRFIAAAVGIINGFILARYYGPAVLGNIAVIVNMVALGSTLALLGSGTLTLRMLPEQLKLSGAEGAMAVYKRLTIMGIVGVMIFLSVWWCVDTLSGGSNNVLKGTSDYTLMISFLVLVAVLRKLNNKTLRGLGDYKYFSLIDISPTILIFITLLLCLAMSIDEHMLVRLYFIPNIIVSLMAVFSVKKIFRSIGVKEASKSEGKTENTTAQLGIFELYRLSIPMFGVTISTALIAYVDILMLNYFLGPEKAGVYSVYVKLVGLTLMIIGSINSMFAPKVASLYAGNELSELRELSKRITLLGFSVALVCACGMLLFHRPMLNLYGDVFTSELPAFYLLLCSSVASAYFGSAGLFLNMTGHQVPFFWIMLMAAMVNMSGNILLIPAYGVVGAAVSTLVAVVFWKALATAKIKKSHGYTLCWLGSK